MFTTSSPFIIAYIEELAKALKYYGPHRDSSGNQKN
jgi:hypothetical protein